MKFWVFVELLFSDRAGLFVYILANVLLRAEGARMTRLKASDS